MQKPNIIRRAIMFVVDSWRVIMDVRFNPLRFVGDPSLQGYFMLVLFTIWSATFGLICTYYLGWYGYDILTSILLHAAILIPLMITNAVFLDAEREGHRWVQEWRKEQSNWKLFVSRTSNGVRIMWDLDKEA